MLERTKRISFRISFVSSKVEPEPDLHTGSDSGSDQKVPAPTGSGSATVATSLTTFFKLQYLAEKWQARQYLALIPSQIVAIMGACDELWIKVYPIYTAFELFEIRVGKWNTCTWWLNDWLKNVNQEIKGSIV